MRAYLENIAKRQFARRCRKERVWQRRTLICGGKEAQVVWRFEEKRIDFTSKHKFVFTRSFARLLTRPSRRFAYDYAPTGRNSREREMCDRALQLAAVEAGLKFYKYAHKTYHHIAICGKSIRRLSHRVQRNLSAKSRLIAAFLFCSLPFGEKR